MNHLIPGILYVGLLIDVIVLLYLIFAMKENKKIPKMVIEKGEIEPKEEVVVEVKEPIRKKREMVESLDILKQKGKEQEELINEFDMHMYEPLKYQNQNLVPSSEETEEKSEGHIEKRLEYLSRKIDREINK